MHVSCLSVRLSVWACKPTERERERVCSFAYVCMYDTRVPIAVVEFAVGEDVHALPMELVVLELPCTW
jgi:hypothetical protein